MAWTFDSALDDELISVVTRDDDMGTFEVRIGALETLVSIELGRFMTDDRTKVFISHAIHTPVQMDPYLSSRSFWDDPAYALHMAISGITRYYREAVQAGHTPADNWLVRR